jgi:hypothetical protein
MPPLHLPCKAGIGEGQKGNATAARQPVSSGYMQYVPDTRRGLMAARYPRA